jgi:hypothetical protein
LLKNPGSDEYPLNIFRNMNPYSYNDEDEMPKDLKENEIIGWKFQVLGFYRIFIYTG